MRSYYATHLRQHGILAEYIDLLQGRIPKSVFARHYLKVEDIKELVKQVAVITCAIEKDLLSWPISNISISPQYLNQFTEYVLSVVV